MRPRLPLVAAVPGARDARPAATGTVSERVLRLADPGEPGITWEFDAAHLLSGHHCVFGTAACRGVEGTPVVGCCTTGAHLGGEEDEALLDRRARELTDADWQLRAEGHARGWTEHDAYDGALRTRLVEVDGVKGCIFANRADHPGGQGCALHAAALRRGEHPVDFKPFVCWLVPLQYEVDEASGIRRVRAYEHERDWGRGESEPLAWWCVDDAGTYDSAQPLYRTMERELLELCGPAVHALLVEALDERLAAAGGGPSRTPPGPVGAALPMLPRP